MRNHTTHFHDCSCLSDKFRAEKEDLIRTLARERDQFGKRETGLMVALSRAKEALENILKHQAALFAGDRNLSTTCRIAQKGLAEIDRVLEGE